MTSSSGGAGSLALPAIVSDRNAWLTFHPDTKE
jgi:hypothetical protein